MKVLSKIKIPVIVIVIVAAMAVLVVRRKAQLQQAKPYGMRPIPVRVVKATQQALESTHSYLGVVEAWQVARVSSRISAKVDAVPRDEGDSVEAGELLLQLDDSDVRAQIKATESTIRGLETNRDFWTAEDRRDSKLAIEGVISSVEAETTQNRMAEAVSRLEAAQGNLDSLRTKLLYTQLTSPFDGLITTRDVDPGDLAAPGHTLMVVEDQSALKIAFDAPQGDLVLLKEGLPVLIDADETTIAAEVTHLYPSLDKARMARAEVALPTSAGLRIGSFFPLSVVLLRHDDVVTVPRECLLENTEGASAVFVFKDGLLEARTVKAGMTAGGRVEVEGVDAGEQVVTSTFLGWSTLASGLKAEVIQ